MTRLPVPRLPVSLTLGAALALALVGASCKSKTAEASCSTAEECLPSVDYTDINAQPFKHAALSGKVVVVNFWATWCGPCKKEIPAFNQVYLAYKAKGVEFLGVLYDNQVDDTGLLNFMSDHEMTYPVIRADRPVLEAYAYPKALPTTFIYDRKGKLLEMHRGPMSEASLRAQLDEALSR